MLSDPQQKLYRSSDETRHQTQPPLISEQYSWWCAGFCLPTTWSPLKSSSFIYMLQVGCDVLLHPSSDATSFPTSPCLPVVFTLSVYLFPSSFKARWSSLAQTFMCESACFWYFERCRSSCLGFSSRAPPQQTQWERCNAEVVQGVFAQ